MAYNTVLCGGRGLGADPDTVSADSPGVKQTQHAILEFSDEQALMDSVCVSKR